MIGGSAGNVARIDGPDRPGSILLPIGFDTGPHWQDSAVTRPGYYEVLTTADAPVLLSPRSYDIWDAAFSSPATTWQGLIDLSIRTGAVTVAEPTAVVDELLALGLLASVNPGSRRAAECFLRAYQLTPSGQGLGNSPEGTDGYRIGPAHGGRTYPVVSVTAALYAVWANSGFYVTVWDAIAALAARWWPRNRTAAAQLADETAAAIPVLVAARCAVLQPTSDG